MREFAKWKSRLRNFAWAFFKKSKEARVIMRNLLIWCIEMSRLLSALLMIWWKKLLTDLAKRVLLLQWKRLLKRMRTRSFLCIVRTTRQRKLVFRLRLIFSKSLISTWNQTQRQKIILKSNHKRISRLVLKKLLNQS